jgi:hypothetical protein
MRRVRTIGRLLFSALIAVLPTVLLLRLHPSAGETSAPVETWPLEFEAIVVDQSGLIFAGVPGYGAVYVYSPEGRFIRKFFVGTARWLELGPGDMLHVIRTKESGMRYTYDKQGKLLARAPQASPGGGPINRFVSPSGEEYLLDGRFGNARIMRTDKGGGVNVVVVDRSLGAGIRLHPGLAASIIALHAVLTLLIFWICASGRRVGR